jgi:hypothetical protein
MCGDRLYFLRNERSLGVKNGSLGTIEKIRDGVLQVRMDGDKGRRVVVDARFYRHLEHGYATTLHKSQSATVARTYVLATPHFDRHSAYVALSRHRESATMFYGQEDFRGGRQPSAEENLKAVLSRARSKELAHDYLEGLRPAIYVERVMEQNTATPAAAMTAADRLRQRADLVAERLAAEREQERGREKALDQHHTPEHKQHHKLEREIEKQHERYYGQELDL